MREEKNRVPGKQEPLKFLPLLGGLEGRSGSQTDVTSLLLLADKCHPPPRCFWGVLLQKSESLLLVCLPDTWTNNIQLELD